MFRPYFKFVLPGMQTHVLSGRGFTLWRGSSEGTPGLGVVLLCMWHWIRSTHALVPLRAHTHRHTHFIYSLHIISHTLCVPDLQILAGLMLRQQTHSHTHTDSQRAWTRVLGFSPLRRVWICASQRCSRQAECSELHQLISLPGILVQNF